MEITHLVASGLIYRTDYIRKQLPGKRIIDILLQLGELGFDFGARNSSDMTPIQCFIDQALKDLQSDMDALEKRLQLVLRLEKYFTRSDRIAIAILGARTGRSNWEHYSKVPFEEFWYLSLKNTHRISQVTRTFVLHLWQIISSDTLHEIF